ncbi:hypothetical protein [Streptomyces flaveus]|nr:hypothetical protein [Streptomyces flaveus]
MASTALTARSHGRTANLLAPPRRFEQGAAGIAMRYGGLGATESAVTLQTGESQRVLEVLQRSSHAPSVHLGA